MDMPQSVDLSPGRPWGGMPVLTQLYTVAQFARRKPLAGVGLVIIALLFIAAVAAPWLGTTDPNATDPSSRWATPEAGRILGGDHLGRDIYSRIIYGSRVSVIIGLGAALTATIVACAIGITSGVRGGWWDLTIQRVVDTTLCFPTLVLLASLSVVLPQTDSSFSLGLFHIEGVWMRAILIAVTLGVIFSFSLSRIIRASVLAVMSKTYIESARATGAGEFRIVVFYVLPNIAPTVLVLATVSIGATILIEASLAFLGFGLPPTIPSWGQMLNEARPGMFRVWNPSIWPGIAIALGVWSFNMVGDGLRDVLDPRLRGG